jgi:hypothetical protein
LTLGAATAVFLWTLVGNFGALVVNFGVLVVNALRALVFLAGFGLATTGFRERTTCFFAALRDTDLAAFLAGALAPLFAFTMCLGRAALVFSGRRFAADF